VKRFGELTAVDDVSFEVRRGEVFAFLGPNGAGKTTTIKMLTTLLRPTSGRVELDGLDPVARRDEVRKRFGVVFQDPSLDQDLTAWENMEIHGVLYGVPRRVRRERAEELLKLFELWERRDSLVKTFSGGMRRRLEIARGLLHTPKVLFLDEPTLGLDPQSRNQMWTHVKKLNESDRVTVFLTTHYMDEAEQLCDRLVVMDGGRIVAEGSPRALIEQWSTREVLELRFADDDHSAFAAAVEGLGERVEVLPDRLLVYTDDGDAAVEAAAGRGLRPLSVLVRRSTLEDVFLRLTGRTLVD
jgi:lipooligosaccharide transport system ATP-binding protein